VASGHSGVLLRGAWQGGLCLVLLLEFIVGPQGAGTSAGRGSLTLGGVEGSISGNVQAFRIPSRSCTRYLVTVPAAREAYGHYLPGFGGVNAETSLASMSVSCATFNAAIICATLAGAGGPAVSVHVTR